MRLPSASLLCPACANSLRFYERTTLKSRTIDEMGITVGVFAAVALIWCGVDAHLAGPGSLHLDLLASAFRGTPEVLE